MTEKKSKKRKILLISISTFIILFSIGSMIFVKSVYDSNFPRVDKAKFYGFLRYSDVKDKYDRTIVKFESGENTLTGYIYGEDNTKGLVVISHGLGFGAERYLPEALYFVDKGCRVFSFDNTGTHESEGKSTVGLPQSVIDLDAALAFVESDNRLKGLPVMLYGHSWGGYAVAAILNYNHNVTAAVSISGFNAPIQLFFDTSIDMFGSLAYMEYPFEWVYQTLLFGINSRITAVDGINRTDTPVMIIHGDNDKDLPYNGASIIAHQNEITNPNVIYKTCSEEGQNGHKTLFKSKESIEYASKMNAEYQEINDKYSGNIPDDVNAEFYSNIDKFLSSKLDADFMNDINSFYQKNLSY